MQQPMHQPHVRFMIPAPNDPGFNAMNNSATTIQRVWRGYTIRKQFLASEDAGTIKVVVHEGQNLHNTQCCWAQDPFVEFFHDKRELRTPVATSGGTQPKFPNSTFYFAVFPKSARYISAMVKNENWFCDDEIGRTSVQIDEVIREFKADPYKEAAPKLFRLGAGENFEGDRGMLCMSVSYFPPLEITFLHAKNIRDVQTIGKQDPYIRMQFRGAIVPNTHRTKTCKDGHTSPYWNEAVKFFFPVNLNTIPEAREDPRPLNDEEKKQVGEDGRVVSKEKFVLTVEIINDNHVSDTAIGWTEISMRTLLEIKHTQQAGTVNLFKGQLSKRNRGECGSLTIHVR